MEVVFYNFSKRANSTKRPISGTKINVVLKETTSLRNPALRLNISQENVSAYTSFNYCVFMGKYYYVSEWTNITKLEWECILDLDILATYKTQIQSTNAFVKYSASEYNADIPDTRMSITNWKSSVMKDKPISYSLSKPSYVITVLGNNGTQQQNELSATYFLSSDNVATLANNLYSADFMMGLRTDFNGGITDGIVGIIYYPFDISNYTLSIGAPKGKINIGTQEVVVGLGAQQIHGAPTITNSTEYDTVIFDIDDYKNANSLDGSTFKKYTLYVPFCGLTELDANLIYDRSYIICQQRIELTTGALSVVIYSSYGREITDASILITTVSGTCGVQIPFGESQMSSSKLLGGAISTIGGAVASALTANPIGAVGGVIGGALSITNGIYQTTSNGAFGSLASLGVEKNNYRLTILQAQTTDGYGANRQSNGMPLFAVRKLSTLSGYIQTEGASVAISAPQDIIEEVNNALNGGIYLE